MADRWDGCVVVATASLDLDRLLRAFRAQVGEEHLQSVEDAPDGLPVLDDAQRLPRGVLTTDHPLLVAAPFPGVGLLLLSPPFFEDTSGRSEAPREYALLHRAVRDVLPGLTVFRWAEHERTGHVELAVGEEEDELYPDHDEQTAERVRVVRARLDALLGVELATHLTAVDLAPGRVSLDWGETDPVRLRAAEEALRTSMGPAPRVPRLELKLDPPPSLEDQAVRRDPAQLAAEQAAYASSQRLLKVLAALVVSIALLVALFAVMAQRWQPR